MSTLEGKNLPVPHCIKGTAGHSIVDEVFNAYINVIDTYADAYEVYPMTEINPIRVDKPTFGSTALADFAEQGGYDAIELIGLCTDICVISNALCLKARLWETPIAVWKDCCAGVTPASHENALSAMAMCQIDIL
jgi:nicotinamidase-related amidase